MWTKNASGGYNGAYYNNPTVLEKYFCSTSNINFFLWQNSTKTDLGTLGGSIGKAISINNQAQVVGFSNTAKNPITGKEVSHAFIWENGQIFALNSLLVRGSGWELTQATGINDRRQIVSYGSYLNVFR